MSNEKQTNKDSVCLKCYKLKCQLRSVDNKSCPNNEGPVDWKGR